MTVDMGQFPPGIVRRGDEVCRVIFPKNRQRLIKSALLDVAVRSKISTGEASVYQVLPKQQGQRSREVVLGEVDLSQPEGVAIVVWED